MFTNIFEALLFTAAVFAEAAFAQQGPSNLNITGELFDSTGTPVTAASVNFKLEIYDKNGTCLLYSENHLGEDLSNTKGGFALQIGDGSSINNSIDASNPTIITSKVFENSGTVAGGWTGCAGGTTLAAGDNRVIRVKYDLGGGYVTMNPDVPIGAAAYSIVAETLQGKRPADFIQVHNDVSNKLTQANVENIFSSTNYPKLDALLQGTSTQYMSSAPGAAVDFNTQRIINVGTPTAAMDAATKGYTDGNIGGKTADVTGVGPATGDGYTLIWDQATQKWTTGMPSSTDNTKLPLAGGTMTGTIDFAAAIGTGIDLNGNDFLGTGHITMSPLKTLTLGTFTTAQETTLVGTLTAANAGASWYNSTTKTFKIWDGSAAISQLSSGTTAGGDLTGTYPNPTIANDKITSAKVDSAGVGLNRLVISDQTTGATLKFATCATNEVFRYEGVNGWTCRDPSSIVTFPVDSVNGKTGTVVLNANDLGLGTAALENVGTGAGDIPQLDAGGKIPSGLIPNLGSGDFMKDGSVAMTGNFNAGGNKVLGNTTASANLVLESTSNATKGFVNIQPAGGNVGIGTTTPVYNLDVSGAARFGGTVIGNELGVTPNLQDDGFGNTYVIAPNASGSVILSNSGSSSSALLNANFFDQTVTIGRNASSITSIVGNVGIGTTAPARPLHVNGAARLTPTTTPVTPAAGDIFFDSAASNALKFYDGSAWQTVGTGTGSGDFKKDGSVAMTGNFNAGGNSVLGNTTASANLTLESTSNATKGSVNIQPNGGNVGIGTTSPTDVLHIERNQAANTGIKLVNTTTTSGSSASVYLEAGSNALSLGQMGPNSNWSDIQTGEGYLSSSKMLFWSNAATGYIRFTMDSTEAMRIDQNAYVGIGTTTPARLLHVNGAARLTPTTTPATPAAGDLFFDSAASNALKFYDGSAWQTVGTGSSSGDFKKDGSIAMTGDFNAGGNSVLGNTSASANLKLESTSNATKGYVLIQPNGGKVGIGTTAPADKLHISETSVAAGIRITNTGTNGRSYALYSTGNGNSSGDGFFGVYDVTNDIYRIAVDPNGKVGMGTTAPLTTLHVRSADGILGGTVFENTLNTASATFTTVTAARRVSSVGSGVGTSFSMNDAGGNLAEYGYFGAIIESATNGSQSGSIAFFPRKNDVRTEALRITSGGSVGIGTTSPQATLDVNGSVKISGTITTTSQAFASLTDGATVTWNVAGMINNAKVTLGGNRTLAFSGLTNGMSGTLIVNQDATGGRTLTLPSQCTNKVINGGSGTLTLSSGANSADIITFVYDGTNCYWTYGTNYN